jgi:hypothetical protein
MMPKNWGKLTIKSHACVLLRMKNKYLGLRSDWKSRVLRNWYIADSNRKKHVIWKIRSILGRVGIRMKIKDWIQIRFQMGSSLKFQCGSEFSKIRILIPPKRLYPDLDPPQKTILPGDSSTALWFYRSVPVSTGQKHYLYWYRYQLLTLQEQNVF